MLFVNLDSVATRNADARMNVGLRKPLLMHGDGVLTIAGVVQVESIVQRLELALAGEELLAELLVGMPSSTNHAWVVRNCTDLAQRACA